MLFTLNYLTVTQKEGGSCKRNTGMILWRRTPFSQQKHPASSGHFLIGFFD
jgi:hypothetical protein